MYLYLQFTNIIILIIKLKISVKCYFFGILLALELENIIGVVILYVIRYLIYMDKYIDICNMVSCLLFSIVCTYIFHIFIFLVPNYGLLQALKIFYLFILAHRIILSLCVK